MATIIIKNKDKKAVEYDSDIEIEEVLPLSDEEKEEEIEPKVKKTRPEATIEEIVQKSVDMIDGDFFGISRVLDTLKQLDKTKIKAKEKGIIGRLIEEQYSKYGTKKELKNRHNKPYYNFIVARKCRESEKLYNAFKTDAATITSLYKEALHNKFDKAVEKNVHTLLVALNRSTKTKKSFNDMVTVLKEIKNEDELKNILPILFNDVNLKILKSYKNEIKYFNNYITYDEKTVLNHLINEVIKIYFENLIAEKDNDQIFKVLSMYCQNESPEKIILELDANFSNQSMENGIFALCIKVFDEILDTYLFKHKTSLCWNCNNGFPSKCTKIADRVKKHIDNYDFIKQGYQIVKNDSIAVFAVTDCEDFKPSQLEKDAPTLKQDIEDLMKNFYGRDTIKEARREMYSRVRRQI